MHVDGLPAVCHNFNCDYTYNKPLGEVSAYHYSETDKTLHIKGIDLPQKLSEIRYVEFAFTRCKVDETSLNG